MLSKDTKRTLLPVMMAATILTSSVSIPLASAAEAGAGETNPPAVTDVTTTTTTTTETTGGNGTTDGSETPGGNTTTGDANTKPDSSGDNQTQTDTETNNFQVTITGDKGVDLDRTKLSVTEGEDASVSANPAKGYRITRIRLNDGVHMETAPVGTGQLLMDGKVYRIDEANGRVALRLTNVESNMEIHFFAEKDPNYDPPNRPFTVDVSGEVGVKIDQTTIDTTRGENVTAVAYAAPGYEITKVRLEDGEHSETARISGKQIVLNGRAYAIERDSGYVKLRLTDIDSDMSVYFYADSVCSDKPCDPDWKPCDPDWKPCDPDWDSCDSDCSHTHFRPNNFPYDINISGSCGVTLDDPLYYHSSCRDVDIVAIAKQGYDITKVRLSDGKRTVTASVSSGCVWLGSTKYLIDTSGKRVILRLTDVSEDLSVYFFTDADKTTAPSGSYGIDVIGDKGVDLEESFLTVKRGKSINISAEALSNYEITKIRVDMGDYQKIGYVSDGKIEINDKSYRITEDGDRVTLCLTNVRDDVTVRFYTDYDKNEYPYVVEVEGDDGVEIDEDSVRVKRGESVSISADAKKGYEIKKVRVEDDSHSETVKVSNGRIWLGDSVYTIRQKDDRVTVYLSNVRDDMVVHFITNIDEDQIPVQISDACPNCRIFTSKSYVKKGDSVIYTVAPEKGYRLKTITLRVGSTEGTASAGANFIKVGDKTYKMSLQTDGAINVVVDDVSEPVKISAETEAMYVNYPSTQNPQYPQANQGLITLLLNHGVTTPYIQGYGNGMFAPKKNITRAEAAVMLARLTNYNTQVAYPSCNVSDVPSNAWYTNEVNAFYAAGIESGTTFRPNAAITRGELAVWLYRLSGSPTIASAVLPFYDIPANTEQFAAVAFGQSQSWINGYGDGTFRPYNAITRAETAKLLNRATVRSMQVKNYSATFFDVARNYWAYNDIMSAANYV